MMLMRKTKFRKYAKSHNGEFIARLHIKSKNKSIFLAMVTMVNEAMIDILIMAILIIVPWKMTECPRKIFSLCRYGHYMNSD